MGAEYLGSDFIVFCNPSRKQDLKIIGQWNFFLGLRMNKGKKKKIYDDKNKGLSSSSMLVILFSKLNLTMETNRIGIL